MSESSKLVVVPTTTAEIEFKKHIEIPNNKRILFSAPFGAGKSYFLESFFNKKDECLSIRLHPVDYSVATNEDVFELLKYDIISALLEKYLEAIVLVKEDFSTILLAQEFIKNKVNFIGLIKNVLFEVVPNGKAIKEIDKWAEATLKEFDAFKADMNNTDNKTLDDYLMKINSTKGSIRERDSITLLIKELVRRIKETYSDKSFVLILDDLDRLDPEHTFRLFNVFTAHHDSKTDTNKFDFDQIIFVCDIKNIHHMFIHKYGKKVDFGGYIDKFYSSRIFYFDFKTYLKQSIKPYLFSKYGFEKSFSNDLPAYVYKRFDFKNQDTDFESILVYIISEFIEVDQIKVRSFERFETYHIPNYTFSIRQGRRHNAYDYHFLVLITTLQQFFAQMIDLEIALSMVSERFHSDYSNDGSEVYYDHSDTIDTLIKYSLPFIIDPKNVFIRRGRGQSQTFQYPNENNENTKIHYNINDEGVITYLSMNSILSSSTSMDVDKIVRPNPYWYILCAFRECVKKGYLKA